MQIRQISKIFRVRNQQSQFTCHMSLKSSIVNSREYLSSTDKI